MPTVLAQRIRWIEINSKKVLLMDFSEASAAESLQLIKEFDACMRDQAPQSILMLTDVTNAAYDPSIARQWKEARNRHDAAIRGAAIFGLQGLVGLAVRGFIEARRLLGLSETNAPRIFSDGESARIWLGEQ